MYIWSPHIHICQLVNKYTYLNYSYCPNIHISCENHSAFDPFRLHWFPPHVGLRCGAFVPNHIWVGRYLSYLSRGTIGTMHHTRHQGQHQFPSFYSSAWPFYPTLPSDRGSLHNSLHRIAATTPHPQLEPLNSFTFVNQGQKMVQLKLPCRVESQLLKSSWMWIYLSIGPLIS